jgi:hypothetical protein
MEVAKIYTLSNINDIINNGFDYLLAEDTINIISNLALQVGSPDYVKTPVFNKKEIVKEPIQKDNSLRKKKNKATEIINDADWDNIRNSGQSFQTTKIEENNGINAKIVIIRTYLNKLTDKNYIDILNKIVEVIELLIHENVDNEKIIIVSSTIFEIASNNRFYSKIYADLYSALCLKFVMLRNTIEFNLDKFNELFSCIEYIDANINYDKFCENNKKNEKRRSLSAFYLNLMMNGIISKKIIINIITMLLDQIYKYISLDDKKNEVDELTENLFILYKKEFFRKETNEEEYAKIDGYTVEEIINNISNSKVKDFKSLTNKTIFKFMDMVDV